MDSFGGLAKILTNDKAPEKVYLMSQRQNKATEQKDFSSRVQAKGKLDLEELKKELSRSVEDSIKENQEIFKSKMRVMEQKITDTVTQTGDRIIKTLTEGARDLIKDPVGTRPHCYNACCLPGYRICINYGFIWLEHLNR